MPGSRTDWPNLPCFPCPHASVCCSWGTMLFDDEVAAIRQRFGDAAVVWSEEEETWRTAVVAGRCFFWKTPAPHGCAIHEEPFYPRVCRGFPERFADSDDPYPYDLTICPELAEPVSEDPESAGPESAGPESTEGD